MPRPDVRIEIGGLEELRARFAAFPGKFGKVMTKTLDTVLLILSEFVPPYPVYESDYIRTGTLGRTLGSNQQGGATGLGAQIHEVKQLGSGVWQGEWGTRLSYAPYVIGTFQQAGHMGHWWRIVTVAQRALPKINEAFEKMAEVLARYLDKGTEV